MEAPPHGPSHRPPASRWLQPGIFPAPQEGCLLGALKVWSRISMVALSQTPGVVPKLWGSSLLVYLKKNWM